MHNRQPSYIRRAQVNAQIRKCYRSMLRDRWGNLKGLPWNGMMKDRVDQLQAILNRLEEEERIAQ